MAAKRSGARGPGARASGPGKGAGAGASASKGTGGGADETARRAARELVALPPWLDDPAARLRRREADGRLPHALLLTGAVGIGKRAFARWLAECLLCRAPTAAGACGACASCRQLLAEAHPDYRELRPEGAGIRIDAVRELMTWQQMSTPEGRWRVALLDGADTLNRNAANALLKTLEEPADGALLLLVADRPGALPATVRSRCQTVALGAGNRDAALDWLAARLDGARDRAAAALALANGAPIAALALADPERARTEALLDKAWLDLMLHRASVSRIAEALAELPAAPALAGFAARAADALRHVHGLPARAGPGGPPDGSGTDGAGESVAARVADRLRAEQWFALRDRIEHLYRIDGPSFRTQAVLEGLLADIRLMLTGDDRP